MSKVEKEIIQTARLLAKHKLSEIRAGIKVSNHQECSSKSVRMFFTDEGEVKAVDINCVEQVVHESGRYSSFRDAARAVKRGEFDDDPEVEVCSECRALASAWVDGLNARDRVGKAERKLAVLGGQLVDFGEWEDSDE